MRRLVQLMALVQPVALLLVLCKCLLVIADDDVRSREQELRQQLSTRDATVRIAALKQLEEMGGSDAAKLVVQNAFRNRDPQVARTAFNVLMKLAEDPAVSESLVTLASKQLSDHRQTDAFYPLVAALACVEQAESRRRVAEFLEKQIGSTKDGMLFATSLADEMGELNDPRCMAALIQLTHTPLFDDSFAFRRAVVRSLTRYQEVEATDALVEILANVRGQVYGDIIQKLAPLAGTDFGSDVDAWIHWWQTQRAAASDGNPIERGRALGAMAGRITTYYGIPIYADRIVFVIDTSSSMRGPKLLAAKRELSQAIANLTDTDHFTVLAFNSRVRPWQLDLKPATEKNKSDAIDFVDALEVHAATSTFDALETALTLDAEAICVATDGQPTTGRVTAIREIISTLTQMNRSRRMSIYTIAIAPGPERGSFASFLRTLAQQNYGEYRRTDQ